MIKIKKIRYLNERQFHPGEKYIFISEYKNFLIYRNVELYSRIEMKHENPVEYAFIDKTQSKWQDLLCGEPYIDFEIKTNDVNTTIKEFDLYNRLINEEVK